MSKSILRNSIFFILCFAFVPVTVLVAETTNPFIGRWALTIPGGSAGWLGVEQNGGQLKASILWGGGSVVPVTRVKMDGDTLKLERDFKIRRRGANGKVAQTQQFTETIIADISNDTLNLTQIRPNRDGKGTSRNEFEGKRIPPLPPRPDLSNVKYGEPIVLFDGTNLDKWKLTNPRRTSGWSIKDGVLVNNPVQQEGKPHISYGNLRTIDEYEDFNLKLEVNVHKRGNSGIYLRGIYEIQISDSYNKPLDSHNMGAVYSRITPSVNAEKPAGQWQMMNITLLDRHVTVELNNKVIIDNEPLLGCTGGALWSDEFRPGPVYLQGDHSAVSYRNIVLTPIVKDKGNK
jgi:hypothetical protein